MIVLRDAVARFAQEMENRLRANDHKGGWQDDPTGYFLLRLREELEELCDAVYAGAALEDPARPATLPPDQVDRIVHEAADVANFAMMLVDVVKSRRSAR